MSPLNKFRLFHSLYLTLCGVGLIWQVTLVSVNYFSYVTDTRVKIRYPKEIYFPTTTICIRYTDILNYEMAYSRGRKWTNSLNESQVLDVQREITIKEIFDLTPNESDIIKTFHHRSETGYSYIRHSHGEIKSVLDVRKFVYVEYICYRIDLKNPIKLQSQVIAAHPIESGTLGKITMNSFFQNITRYKMSLTTPRSFPYNSLMVQPIIRRSRKDRKLTV